VARKQLTQTADIVALASQAQDLALTISRAAEGFDIMAPAPDLLTAQSFNQLIEACGYMNRMILARSARDATLAAAMVKAARDVEKPRG